MKKKAIIERIQMALNGGRLDNDAELKNPYGVIESLVDSTILEIITAKDVTDSTDSISGRIAVPYIIDVTNYKQVNLPHAPANRTNSILSIRGISTGAIYGIRTDVAKINIMGALRPYSDAGAYSMQIEDTWALVFDKPLRMDDKKIEVFMIPSFSSLGDDDDFFMDGNENLIDDLIIPRMRYNETNMDTLNNQVYDTNQKTQSGGSN